MRIEASGGAVLRSVATDMSVGALVSAGFAETRMNGKYHVLERQP